MAVLPNDFTYTQYSIVYNVLSFGIACMGAATVFFFGQVPYVGKSYKTALMITGLVVLIACYHYFRIFNSFADAFMIKLVNGTYTPVSTCDPTPRPECQPFNDGYRYVDWLLTVPLLLLELILVMKLPSAQTTKLGWQLGLASALMICLGYPGEISDDNTTRWIFWALAMVCFSFVVFTLYVGLKDSIRRQAANVQGLVSLARHVTVISWLTYPIVYLVKNVGISGTTATTAEQVGYTIADIIAKAVFGVLIWKIAATKTANEEGGSEEEMHLESGEESGGDDL